MTPRAIGVRSVAHHGIAVTDLPEAVALYTQVLGYTLVDYEEVSAQQVRVAMLQLAGQHVELLSSLTPDGPIGRFLAKRGAGLHHVALWVEDVEQALRLAEAQGMRLIDAHPRPGAGHCLVAFLHPQAGAGVLYELCQPDPARHG